MLSFTRQSYYFFLFHRLSPYIFFKKAPYIISFHYLYLTNLLFKTQIKRPKQIHPTKKMKTRIIITLLLLCSFCIMVHAATPRKRAKVTFDQGWTFKLCGNRQEAIKTLSSLGIAGPTIGDSSHGTVKKTKVTDDTEPEQAQVTASEVTTSASDKTYADKAFRPVTIPHDWSIELPFDANVGGSAGYLPGGQGVYVKDFTLPAEWAKRLTEGDDMQILFDGVYHRATVWLNGHRLGHHMYGYTGFLLDITHFLNAKGQNRLVVHVDREEQSRWYTGSGIYRHVWLQATNKVHVKENGIFVKATADGTLRVQTEVEGDDANHCTITHTVFDGSGKKIASLSGKAGSELTLRIKNPALWSVDHPAMYAIKTLVRSKGSATDEITTSFGFRDIRFDANTGFYLNEMNMKLKGMCLHQDAGSLGVAVPDEVWLRRLKALKDLGCNSIRCSHNPPSPEFLTMCDTLGLLVIDEAFDKWKSGYYEPFYDDNAHKDIADMVLRDRNHPSVFIWSIGNELSEAWNKDNSGVERAATLNSLVKSIDPTRPTMVACQQGFEDKFGEVTDIVGYNYLEPRMIADHKRHPQRKMLVSEAFVYYSGLREDVVRDFVEHNPWHFVEENPFIAGSYVWAGVDYLGESSPWPAKGWCSCPFDMTLKERPQAAFYHPAWNPDKDYLKLVVRDNCFDQAMGTDHWQYPPMADTWDLPYTDSRCVEVRCYTTCDSVQFFFPMWSNPQLPLKPRVTAQYPDNCITVQLPARQGKVLAVGYKGGKEVVRDSLVNHGPVADVRLDADRTTLSAASPDFSEPQRGCTVSHIRLSLIDKDGQLQQMQPRRFMVEVEGPIRLLGVETGDMRRNDSWRTTELNTYFGEGLIRLQSTTQRGTAKVRVFVEGFEHPFTKEITVK